MVNWLRTAITVVLQNWERDWDFGLNGTQNLSAKYTFIT